MTADERLRAIKQRAEATKFAFGKSGVTINGVTRYFIANTEEGYEFLFPATPTGFQATERLLSCWEPGAVVTIHEDNIASSVIEARIELMDNPPSPGTYKLIPVEVDDENGT